MVLLPKNKTTVLKAQDPKYTRGLLVKYNDDGSYDMQYWFDKPSDVYPVEVTVDDKSVKKDAKKVSMLYHPELGMLGQDFVKSASSLNLNTPLIRNAIVLFSILKLIRKK